MAATGVLPFLRGIDFSRNDFSGDAFPREVEQMAGLRWLKLNKTDLNKVPSELSHLKSLEHLQMNRNSLTSLHGELSDLPCLRSIIARHNQIKTSSVPTDIFNMQDLTIVDFSHNSLKDVPPNLEKARCVIVLNLSHNAIETIPNQLFVSMDDLLYLDLSHNKLEMLPPQMRRLIELKVLILNDNPLQHFQLKQLPSMTQLRVLHMRNTQRNAANIPSLLDNLLNLEDVDFSQNNLINAPNALVSLRNLRKLNLSDNAISKLPSGAENGESAGVWPELEILNCSRNELTHLPNELLSKWVKLKKLFLNNNRLTFDGIPANCSKLINLEIFHAAYNNLELIPEGLARCPKLRRVKLNNNRLITVPDTLYLLSDLHELDLRNNPDIIMPPKPSELRKARLAFYNIDFSLEGQMRMASGAGVRTSGGPAVAGSSSSLGSSSGSWTPKDPVARKMRLLRNRKGQAAAVCGAGLAGAAPEPDADQRKILSGLTEVAKERSKAEEAMEESRRQERLSKKWDESLEKPPVNYDDLFDADIGQIPGLTVWEIENFLPNLLDEAFHGKFYEGDCYIVLKTFIDQSNQLNWQIFYWIGERATLDKKACSAIHAVNLRNYLGACCRTIREEMNEESDEFLDVFGGELIYVAGERTSSGFYNLEEQECPTKMYRVSVDAPGLHLEVVALNIESLDPRFVFLVDAGKTLFVWNGRKSGGVLRTKTRLFAEKINKTERKGDSEIAVEQQGQESVEFWALFGIKIEEGAEKYKPEEPIVEHVPSDFKPRRPVLYNVKLGMGFLELPQVEAKRGHFRQKNLESKCVYILDCYSDLYIWIGEKSTRLVRAAGIKCAAELHAMIDRPEYAMVSKVNEGSEPMVFKTKFSGWDDVIAVDFTRTAESVSRRGADLNVILERDKMKTDLAALFLERQPIMPDDEADQTIAECNDDLELMESFVLEGKKFVRLPENEFGIFYTQDCYVFLCRYWMPAEEEQEEGDEEQSKADEATASPARDTAKRSPSIQNPKEEEAGAAADDFQCVVYFWQGRDAGNMGWLTFTFSLQKKFEALFKDKLEVVRMYQQQENHKFLSHFNKMCVIRRGRRNLGLLPGALFYPAMFQTRANGSSICTRTIQIDNKADYLNSEFCYIVRYPLRVPDDDGSKGFIFVWLGSKSKPSDHVLVEKIAQEKLNPEQYAIKTMKEGEEDDRFWEALSGGKKLNYDKEADFMRYSRLFRCTNEKGYFVVSEKTIDFCQDDLDDDDVMILDNGDQVFLWCGVRASEVEIKLAYKAAQVYIQNLRLKQADRPRKLCLTLKGKESKRFTKCFHAWSKHKVPAGD